MSCTWRSACLINYAGVSLYAEVDGIQVTSGSQPAIDGWQHTAAVWDDGQLKIYVNGQFDGVINTGSPIPNSFDLWIGSSPFGADTNWRGAIDEVRIWAVARTQEQIQSTMNQYLCGDERGLRAYWSFDEGQGEELRDTISHSNGVISGPEWVPGVELARSEGCQDKLHRR
jgi:Concanavalin A-like lectin/glucanases superfamily